MAQRRDDMPQVAKISQLNACKRERLSVYYMGGIVVFW